ncbi:MAG: hypothetical protein I8H91_13555 [Burkholderiales bacterium]|nr:hypothetical protein [Burkholderiales bacterium]
MKHVFHGGSAPAGTRRILLGHRVTHGDLVPDHPYTVPSLAGASNGTAYLRGIQNTGVNCNLPVAA